MDLLPDDVFKSDIKKVSVHTINECQGKSDSNQLIQSLTDYR